MTTSDNHYLTTKELADLLRIKERKVYDLVASGNVPYSRATGKLLFPLTEIQTWISSHGSGFVASAQKTIPKVALGSHDPLLDWAIRESRCGLATYCDGSEDGLARFSAAEGMIAGLHLIDPPTKQWNIEQVKKTNTHTNSVLIEFAWRERGFMLSRDSNLNTLSFTDLPTLRIVGRQPGAGAQTLFEFELHQQDIDIPTIQYSHLARTEADAAQAITMGKADIAFGVEVQT
ncbi:MAG: helix-turn-helix domain-containing protein [Gammaproteobacteria bacterium]|nr:helix-turn-helix domain-containing protein [Gammaproteobacteria bacterium]